MRKETLPKAEVRFTKTMRIEDRIMKKIYEAPKAVKHSFESKDIITASSMLRLGGDNNDGIGAAKDVMTIKWSDWQ